MSDLNNTTATILLNQNAKEDLAMNKAIIPPKVVIMILYALIFLIGSLGNSFVIFAILKFRRMQTIFNTYLLNLAFADMIYLSGIPFALITMSENNWIFGKVMCKFYMVFSEVNQFVISVFLLVLSFDRYLAVCLAMKSAAFRKPHIARWTCLGVWIFSSLIMLPIFLYANIQSLSHHQNSCQIIWPQDFFVDPNVAFLLYTFSFAYAIPITISIILYSCILIQLRKFSLITKKKSTEVKKVTLLSLSVILAYICCWSPYWIFQFFVSFEKIYAMWKYLPIAIYLMAYTSSCLNPILYCFLSSNFRESMIESIHCRFHTSESKYYVIKIIITLAGMTYSYIYLLWAGTVLHVKMKAIKHFRSAEKSERISKSVDVNLRRLNISSTEEERKCLE